MSESFHPHYICVECPASQGENYLQPSHCFHPHYICVECPAKEDLCES